MFKKIEFFIRFGLHTSREQSKHIDGNFLGQECIPVECVPSAAVAISLAMHAPAMPAPCHAHPSCHTCPLPCMPPYHACPHQAQPLPCMPPAMHALGHACPLTCMPPTTHAPASMHAPATPLPPLPHGQTDACENITFPQLLLRTVKM